MIRYLLLPLTVFCLSLNCDITAQTTATVMPRVNVANLFSGDRAMADLVKQYQAGPRLPDSPGLATTRKLIKDTLSQNGWTVETQDFTGKSELLQQTVDGQNIFGVYPKGATVKSIVSAHYDTRPFADMDRDPNRREEPVPGANDGASGVAVLLELARVIPQANPKHGIALVFFDLEDHGMPANDKGFCIGSGYFAKHLPKAVQGFQYGINLDMIGDADLTIPIESNSARHAPALTNSLWRLGNALYPNVWNMDHGPEIYDDHMPFIAEGYKFIDVIDIQYPAWHTTYDTPDQCSAQSLDSVGDTIATFILQ